MAVSKAEILDYYRQHLAEKANRLQQILADLRDSGKNETKSTAGDKHETALAMLQIEQENTRKQLADVLAQQAVLEKIDSTVVPVRVVIGSLVYTNRGLFFVSTAMTKATINDSSVIALSPASPLGTCMLGCRVGDSFSFNGMSYVIDILA